MSWGSAYIRWPSTCTFLRGSIKHWKGDNCKICYSSNCTKCILILSFEHTYHYLRMSERDRYYNGIIKGQIFGRKQTTGMNYHRLIFFVNHHVWLHISWVGEWLLFNAKYGNNEFFPIENKILPMIWWLLTQCTTSIRLVEFW